MVAALRDALLASDELVGQEILDVIGLAVARPVPSQGLLSVNESGGKPSPAGLAD